MTTTEPLHEAAIIAGMKVAAEFLHDRGLSGSAAYLWAEILRMEDARKAREAKPAEAKQ